MRSFHLWLFPFRPFWPMTRFHAKGFSWSCATIAFNILSKRSTSSRATNCRLRAKIMANTAIVAQAVCFISIKQLYKHSSVSTFATAHQATRTNKNDCWCYSWQAAYEDATSWSREKKTGGEGFKKHNSMYVRPRMKPVGVLITPFRIEQRLCRNTKNNPYFWLAAMQEGRQYIKAMKRWDSTSIFQWFVLKKILKKSKFWMKVKDGIYEIQ